MLVSKPRSDTSLWCTTKKALLKQKWLIDFFNRVRFLTNRSGNRTQSNRAAIEFLDYRAQDTMIDLIQSKFVNTFKIKCLVCYLLIDFTVGANLGIVTHATHQTQGNTRRTA